MIGFVSSSTINQIVRKLGQLSIDDNPTPTSSKMTSTTSFAQSINVNLVKTSKYNQACGRKNRNQRKKNAPTEHNEKNAKEPNVGSNKGKKKVKFHFLACK